VILPNTPNVDIIIPFHRNDELLQQAINSAKSSIGINPRLVLVNDTGKTITWKELGLESTDLLLNSVEKGYVEALKTGVNATTAEFVAFLDSDDLTHPNRICIQITKMREDDVDYVSGRLCKFGKSIKKSKNRSPLGDIPECSDPRLVLLLGPHGADSTILAKGTSIRKFFSSHSTYPAAIADYGWMLSVLSLGQTISHEPSAVYYYRSHGQQISRRYSLGESWPLIWPQWNILRQFLAGKLENFSKLQLTSQVALALAFPAALPKLHPIEVKQLKNAIESFLTDLKKIDEEEFAKWEITLWRRYILSSRHRGFRKFKYFPGMLIDLAFQKLQGVKTRKSK
jgi:glycosyltransferase involved in cell wall biosynthesis